MEGTSYLSISQITMTGFEDEVMVRCRVVRVGRERGWVG